MTAFLLTFPNLVADIREHTEQGTDIPCSTVRIRKVPDYYYCCSFCWICCSDNSAGCCPASGSAVSADTGYSAVYFGPNYSAGSSPWKYHPSLLIWEISLTDDFLTLSFCITGRFIRWNPYPFFFSVPWFPNKRRKKRILRIMLL